MSEVTLPEFDGEIRPGSNELHIRIVGTKDLARDWICACYAIRIRETKDEAVFVPIRDWALVSVLNKMRVGNMYVWWSDVYKWDGKEWTRQREGIEISPIEGR